jgi:hypothetical protein
MVGSGITQFSFSISGNVPPGTTLDQVGLHSAVLGGTPTVPGVYTYTITAFQTNGPGTSVQITDTLKVFGLVTTSIPDGTVGTDYSEQLTTAGGTAPVTFALIGALPDGMTLSPTGLISGTPTTDETSAFMVKFTDAEGGTCQQDMSITIAPIVSGCSVFSNLVWTQNLLIAPATEVFSGGDGTVSSSGTCTNDDSAIIGHGSYIGNGTYNGPASNCNLHIVASGTAGVDPGASYLNVEIYFDGASVAHAYIYIDVTIFLGPGTYDIPFSMPDTGGVDVAVEVDVEWRSGLTEVAGTGPVSLDGSFHLTSVCA